MTNSLRYLWALFWLAIFVTASQPAISAQQRPARTLGRYVKANGIRVHYLEWAGKGTPVALVHGLADTAQVWSAIALSALLKPHQPKESHYARTKRIYQEIHR